MLSIWGNNTSLASSAIRGSRPLRQMKRDWGMNKAAYSRDIYSTDADPSQMSTRLRLQQYDSDIGSWRSLTVRGTASGRIFGQPYQQHKTSRPSSHFQLTGLSHTPGQEKQQNICQMIGPIHDNLFHVRYLQKPYKRRPPNAQGRGQSAS